MEDSLEERMTRLEAEVAELREFKETVERFMFECRLRDILYYAGDALELTGPFRNNRAGHYCRKCFFEKSEFYLLNRIMSGFQTRVGNPMANAMCIECDTLAAIGSRGNLVFP